VGLGRSGESILGGPARRGVRVAAGVCIVGFVSDDWVLCGGSGVVDGRAVANDGLREEIS